MSFSEDILQQIEDYLNGEMNMDQIATFERQIEANSDLADAIDLNKKMRLQYYDKDWDFIKGDKKNKRVNELESILKSDEFLDKRAAIETANDMYFGIEEKKSSGNTTKVFYALAIAASLALLFGVFFKYNTQNTVSIYNEYNSWQELPSLVSRSETASPLLSNGENAFINKNYQLAKENFSNYNTNIKVENINLLLYLGISHLELENYNAALFNFQKVIASDSMDSSKGYWYKALTYLKMEDKDNAIKELEIIINNTSNFNFEKAKDILEKIR